MVNLEGNMDYSFYGDRQYSSYDSSSKGIFSSSKSSVFLTIITTVVVFLICISVYRVAVGNNIPLFSDFLAYLQNMKVIDLNLNIIDFAFLDSWGLFDFLRIAINSLIAIINAGYFVLSNVFNALSLLVSFLGFALGGLGF